MAWTGLGVTAGPASVSLSNPPPPHGPWVTPSLRPTLRRLGERCPGCWPSPACTRTGTLNPRHHCQLRAAAPRGPRRAPGRSGPSSVQPAEAGERPRRTSGERGDRAGCHPLPAASARGVLALSSAPSPHSWQGRGGAPALGSVESCYSVPNPAGHRAIYLDVGPALPAPPTLHFRKRRTLHPCFRPPLPRGPSAALGTGSGDRWPAPPRPAALSPATRGPRLRLRPRAAGGFC